MKKLAITLTTNHAAMINFDRVAKNGGAASSVNTYDLDIAFESTNFAYTVLDNPNLAPCDSFAVTGLSRL